MNKPEIWIEIRVRGDGEALSALSNFFFESGSAGVHEEEDAMRAYFVRDPALESVKKALNRYIAGLREMGRHVEDPEYRILPPQDWGEKWRDYFKPVKASSRIVVKPPWEEYQGPEDTLVIDINPQMAFGTGTHETTQLCLGFLEERVRPLDQVLDLGTGSGILSIAAIRLGAGHAVAVDTDPEAVNNAAENVRLNGVADRIEILCGSLESVPERRFDVIAANIDRKTLTGLLPDLKSFCRPGTDVILSGLLQSDREVMTSLLESAGYETLEIRTRGEWIGILMQPGS